MKNQEVRCEICDWFDCTCRCKVCWLLRSECVWCWQTDFHAMLDNVRTLFLMQGGTKQNRNNELQKHFFIMYRNSNGQEYDYLQGANKKQ